MNIRSWPRRSPSSRTMPAGWKSFARNPWVISGVTVVFGLLGSWLLFERDGPGAADDPDPARPEQVALGDTLTVPDASVRLHAFECGLTEVPERFSDPKGQYCALTIAVRNDGNTVGPPLSNFSWTLFVGDDKFYGRGPYGVGGLFPDEEGNGTVVFDIPPRVVPSRLEITHIDLYREGPEFKDWVLGL